MWRQGLTRSTSASGLQDLSSPPVASNRDCRANTTTSTTTTGSYVPKEGKNNRTEEISLAASIRRFLEEDFEQQEDAAQREKEQQEKERRRKEKEASPRHKHRHRHRHRHHQRTRVSTKLIEQQQPPQQQLQASTSNVEDASAVSSEEMELMERREAVVALMEQLLDIEDEVEEGQPSSAQPSQQQQPQQQNIDTSNSNKKKIEDLHVRFGAAALEDMDHCFVRWLKKARMYREFNRQDMHRPLPPLPPAEFPAPVPATSTWNPASSSAHQLKASAYRPVLSRSVLQPVNPQEEILLAAPSPISSLPPIRIAPEVDYAKLALENYQKYLLPSSLLDSLFLSSSFFPSPLCSPSLRLFLLFSSLLRSLSLSFSVCM